MNTTHLCGQSFMLRIATMGAVSILGLSLFAGCSRAARARSVEDLQWMCSGDTACMRVCHQADLGRESMDTCQTQRQEAYERVYPQSREPGQGAAPLTPSQIAARSVPSVVVLKTNVGMGSGFAVGRPGRVLTNLHVLAGAKKLEAFLVDGTPLRVVGLLGWDTVNDVALVQVKENLPPLVLSSEPPYVGQSVVAIGNPLGFTATVTDGLVSGLRREESTDFLQISAPIAPGSSGGPVINIYGQVVGVSVATVRGGQNLNLAVPSKYAAFLLKSEAPASLEALAKALEEKAPASKVSDADKPALAGCNAADKKYLGQVIGETLEIGDVLCEAGKTASCVHLYEGAAGDVEKGISESCKGPRDALIKARTDAKSAKDDAERARGLARALKSVAAAVSP